MDSFTLITGITSLLGFAIQVLDLFPKLGNSRKAISLVLLGVFIGSLSRILNPSSVQFSIEISGYVALVASIFIIVVTLLFIAALTEDKERRDELYGVTGVATVTLFIVWFFGGLGGFLLDMPGGPERDREKLTNMELSLLVKRAEESNDYDRAISHLKELRYRVDTSAVKDSIDERLRKLEAISVK